MPRGKYDEAINEAILSALSENSSIRFLKLRDKVSISLSRPRLSYETFNKHLIELQEKRLVAKARGRYGGYYLLYAAAKKQLLGIVGANDKERSSQRTLSELLLFAAKNPQLPYPIQDLGIFLKRLGVRKSRLEIRSMSEINGYAQFISELDSANATEAKVALWLFKGRLLNIGIEAFKLLSRFNAFGEKGPDWENLSRILRTRYAADQRIRQVTYEAVRGIKVISNVYKSAGIPSEITKYSCHLPGISIRDFVNSREDLSYLPTKEVFDIMQLLVQHNLLEKAATLGHRDRFAIRNDKLLALLREILLINRIDVALLRHELQYHGSLRISSPKALGVRTKMEMYDVIHLAEMRRQTYMKIKMKDDLESREYQNAVNMYRERLEMLMGELADKVNREMEAGEFSFLDDALKSICYPLAAKR